MIDKIVKMREEFESPGDQLSNLRMYMPEGLSSPFQSRNVSSDILSAMSLTSSTAFKHMKLCIYFVNIHLFILMRVKYFASIEILLAGKLLVLILYLFFSGL